MTHDPTDTDEDDDSTTSDDLIGIDDRLRRQTHTLDTTDPTSPRDDLEPLLDRLAESRVIGLGESTHGTREFTRLKHRIVRGLVEDHGLRLVAVEANHPESLALTEYVLHGDGTAEDAIAATYFWIHATTEFRELIEWIREFNRDRPLVDRVRVHGVDAQFTAGAAERLRAVLDDADPTLGDDLAADLDTLDDGGATADDPDLIADRVDAADRVVSRFRAALDANAADYASATSERAVERACRFLRVIEQASDRKRAIREDDHERAMRVRDRAMAENTRWLLDHEGVDRLALWAHDCHVCRTENRASGTSTTAPSVGSRLAGRLGDDYYALGFDFLDGSFRAGSESDGEWELGEHSLGAPPAGSATRALAAVGDDVSFLDLRSVAGVNTDADAVTDAETNAGLGAWIAEPRAKRSLGAVYYGPDGPDGDDRDGPAVHNVPRVLSEAFDGLLFVRETTPTRSLAGDGSGEE